MELLFNDCKVLVTGASSGIGKSAALTFVREGAGLILLDIDEEGIQSTIDAIQSKGGEAEFFKCDVSNEEEVVSVFGQIKEKYGKIDAAFNNAGVGGQLEYIVDSDASKLDHILDNNLRSVFFCLREELKIMQDKGKGAIVNASSLAGLVGLPGISHYSASKHGVIGFTKNAALEHAPQNIRVNAVCPGPIETPMIKGLIGENGEHKEQFTSEIPMGRLGDPEEVAEAVVWLCSDKASFVTGHTLTIDGGLLAH